MAQHFDGQVVMITGAARGIGAATARALADRGARLLLTDLDAEPLEALAEELGSDRALAVVADVCDLAAMQYAVAQGVAQFGGLDHVVANAGIASYGSVLQVDPATFKRVLDVNVLGVFHTVRAALPALIESRGYVLVVSSLAAFAPAPGLVAYNASKAGVEHLGNALRVEVAHHGVEVGVAHMSWIDTPLVRDAKADLGAFREMISGLPGPMSRTLPVEDCAEAFLAALAGRKRRVYVPGFVRLVGWLKPLLTSRLGEARTLRMAPELLRRMDAEVRALGRSTSGRNTAMADHAVEP
jgi:NAD(P)-dependent dehydrogenase (short-subunit alcohol dehydrogenase family)